MQRGLIVGRVGRPHGCFRGKLALREAVQAVCLPCHLDVVGNIGLFAHQFVRLDQKTADVPADHAHRRITDYGRNNGRNIHAHCKDEQQERSRKGQSAPGQQDAAAEPSAESAGAARDQQKQNGGNTRKHGQGKQPAGDKLPGGQGEEIEVQRPAKDGIGDAPRGLRCVPVERQRGPLRLHCGAGRQRNNQRNANRDEMQNRLDREIDRLAPDENRMIARQIGQMRPLEQ